jgi:hypothetical protein
MPHFHLSGMEGIILFLYVVAVFGALHILASSVPNNPVAKAWLSLNF